MKPHERRAAGCTVYFKVAAWNARSFCWQDAAPGYKGAFATEAEARAACTKPGRYRISRIEVDVGRTDGEPFNVAPAGPTGRTLSR